MRVNLLRAIVASSLGFAAGIFGFAAGAGLTASWWAAALIGAASAVLVAWLFMARPIVPLDEAACSRELKIVSGVASLVALVQLARLAVFMVDPSQINYSFVPSSKWEVEHSCLSAYFVSAQASSSGQDIYDDSLFTAPDDVSTEPRKALMLGPFKIDVFEYPPTFLLLPRALLLLTPDFTHLRMLWFGVTGGVVLLAFLVVARFMGPAAGTRALLLAPLVWVAFPTLSVLQKGNVQVTVIAAAMLAMVLFERRHDAAGGAILAFATMSKLYPGMLLVVLLAQRRWRALAFTAAFGFVFLVASLVDTGWAPYEAFFHRLPGILGGEAFPAFRNPAAMAKNFSIPGLVFKLKLFGVPGMGFAASKIVGWAYTVLVVAAAVFAGRRDLRDDWKPVVWMAILILATLRSPFLPQGYATFPPLWLLTLMAGVAAPTAGNLSVILLAWAALNVYWPMDWPKDPKVMTVVFVLPQAVTIILAVLALRPLGGWAGSESALPRRA